VGSYSKLEHTSSLVNFLTRFVYNPKFYQKVYHRIFRDINIKGKPGKVK